MVKKVTLLLSALILALALIGFSRPLLSLGGPEGRGGETLSSAATETQLTVPAPPPPTAPAPFSETSRAYTSLSQTAESTASKTSPASSSAAQVTDTSATALTSDRKTNTSATALTSDKKTTASAASPKSSETTFSTVPAKASETPLTSLAAGCCYYPDLEAEVVRLVNVERAIKGLAPLTMNASLRQSAKIRAEETVRSFSHTRPNGSAWRTVIAIRCKQACENIASGQRTAERAVRAWMESEGHRKNILNPAFSQIGVGCYFDPDDPYRFYWVQLFTGG